MAEERIYYSRIAQAEQAIMDANYVRNVPRSLWVDASGKTAKVVHEQPGKFYVEWS